MDLDEVVRDWTESFTLETLEFSSPEDVTDEQVFADIYNALIHSAQFSSTLIQLEQSYAETVDEKCRQRDAEFKVMDRSHAEEMRSALESESGLDDSSINDLAGKHTEERQMRQSSWESELDNLKRTQRREFRDWVMCVFEEMKEADNAVAANSANYAVEPYSKSQRQESFTITLGAQMKQMHNLRLISADILDLCKYPDNQEEALPKRMQTSMSLYSNNLSGLVLLTDNNKLSEYSSSLSRDFFDLSQRSTEFHFQSVEEQLNDVREESVPKVLEWREERRKRRKSAETHDSKYLKNGDFFITKHSNLCQVHAVFHMICDLDSVLSPSITSRHPVVLGLRNVLKTASLSDVTTVTLPLLLVHEMTEEMTVAWCMKRAELAFKCVKGFMMEMTSWGGSEIKTLQFIIPKNVDQDVFNKIAAMLSSIFRTSNPIRAD